MTGNDILKLLPPADNNTILTATEELLGEDFGRTSNESRDIIGVTTVPMITLEPPI